MIPARPGEAPPRWLLLLGLLLLAVPGPGCDSSSPPSAGPERTGGTPAPSRIPARVNRSTPRATVEAWLAAVREGNRPFALSLGTGEWATREKTGTESVTNRAISGGVKLQYYEIRDPAVDGKTATVPVHAVFLRSGEEESEELRFELIETGGAWSITKLN